MSIEVDVKLPSFLFFARARIYTVEYLYLYTVLYQDFRLSCHEQETIEPVDRCTCMHAVLGQC